MMQRRELLILLARWAAAAGMCGGGAMLLRGGTSTVADGKCASELCRGCARQASCSQAEARQIRSGAGGAADE